MTKEQIKERCRRILNSDQRVVASVEDFNFLIGVFKEHPYWDKKTKGLKIVRIEIGKAKGSHPTKCFYIVRENGEKTDISYIWCINKDNLKKKDVIQACRTAVDERIRTFKANLKFPLICPIDGVKLMSLSDVDIDHYDLTFDELVNLWIDKHGGVEVLWKYVNEIKDCDTDTCFTSPELNKDFVDFHDAHTHLRAISKHANRSTNKKGKTNRNN